MRAMREASEVNSHVCGLALVSQAAEKARAEAKAATQAKIKASKALVWVV